jgi:hypothetical protein
MKRLQFRLAWMGLTDSQMEKSVDIDLWSEIWAAIRSIHVYHVRDFNMIVRRCVQRERYVPHR